MYINDRIPEERNEIVLKHAFEEEDENEEEVMGIFFFFYFFVFICSFIPFFSSLFPFFSSSLPHLLLGSSFFLSCNVSVSLAMCKVNLSRSVCNDIRTKESSKMLDCIVGRYRLSI